MAEFGGRDFRVDRVQRSVEAVLVVGRVRNRSDNRSVHKVLDSVSSLDDLVDRVGVNQGTRVTLYELPFFVDLEACS